MRSHITTERDTRRERVDPRLQEAGWRLTSSTPGAAMADGCAIREFPTASGPADYALWLGGRVVAVIEAKKLTIGPQGVLTQAERLTQAILRKAFRGELVPQDPEEEPAGVLLERVRRGRRKEVGKARRQRAVSPNGRG